MELWLPFPIILSDPIFGRPDPEAAHGVIPSAAIAAATAPQATCVPVAADPCTCTSPALHLACKPQPLLLSCQTDSSIATVISRLLCTRSNPVRSSSENH